MRRRESDTSKQYPTLQCNWIDHILRRNCLLHDDIEGQMTEVKEVGRRTQILDDLRNRIGYWELKEESEDRKWCKQQFINRTYGRNTNHLP